MVDSESVHRFQWNKLDADGTDMFNAHFIEPRRYTLLGAIATSVNLKRFSMQASLLLHRMYMTGALGGWKQRRIKTYSLHGNRIVPSV